MPNFVKTSKAGKPIKGRRVDNRRVVKGDTLGTNVVPSDVDSTGSLCGVFIPVSTV